MQPHALLTAYYRTDEEKRSYFEDLFNRGAVHYDWASQILSLGTGRWYRRFALARAGLRPGMQMLDVASGTGLVARAAAAVTGAANGVVALEPCEGMIRKGRSATAASHVRGLAQTLPFRDARFDLVTMAYALRHVPDLVGTFREFRRVLRPGGTVLLLEIARPTSHIGLAVLQAHMGRFVPWTMRFTTGSRDAERMMRYYWETVLHCVSAPVIMDALQRAGLEAVQRKAYASIFVEYHARRL